MTKISQLDLLMSGRKNIARRIAVLESSSNQIQSTPAPASVEILSARGNLFFNSSFEYFDNGSTAPQNWTSTGTVTVEASPAVFDGSYEVDLGTAAELAQTIPTIGQCSVVVSVFAKTSDSGQEIAIEMTHTAGYTAGNVFRIDPGDTASETAVIPDDGEYYRFYRQFILTGGTTATVTFGQAGSAGTVTLDAAKFEFVADQATWLVPTEYQSNDWGASVHIRNLSADNIVAGTLTIGGTQYPTISVLDGTDTEIVRIGDSGTYKGIEIKGAAGAKITGTGSLLVGTAGAQRTEVNANGVEGYDNTNTLQTRMSSSDGKFYFGANRGQLNNLGIQIERALIGSGSTYEAAAYKVVDASNNVVLRLGQYGTLGYLYHTYSDNTASSLELKNTNAGTGTATTTLSAECGTTSNATVRLTATKGSASADLYISTTGVTAAGAVGTNWAFGMSVVLNATDSLFNPLSFTNNGTTALNGNLTAAAAATQQLLGTVTLGGTGKTTTINGALTTSSSGTQSLLGDVTLGGSGKTTTVNGTLSGASTGTQTLAGTVNLGGSGKTVSVVSGSTLALGTNLAWSGNLALPSTSTLTLLNSWVSFGSPYPTNITVSKDALGMVRVHGVIKNGTATAGTVIATLPSGFRPLSRLMFPSVQGDNTGCRVDVQSTGDITVHGVTNNAAVTLYAIQFFAGL